MLIYSFIQLNLSSPKSVKETEVKLKKKKRNTMVTELYTYAY